MKRTWGYAHRLGLQVEAWRHATPPGLPTINLSLEAISPVKHEFLSGQVWAMAGGTPDHAGVAVNVSTSLTNQLRERPCRVFGSDLRVRVQATGLATYPDVSVVCGSLEFDPQDAGRNTVINPVVIVEVLSPSTEDYDRGEKLAHYKSVASLAAIVLIAHDEHRIEHWRRVDERWTLEVAGAGGVVELGGVECRLEVAEVYRDPLDE